MDINEHFYYLSRCFVSAFAEHINGRYLCPHCSDGALHLDVSSLQYKETEDSKSGRCDPAWEPDWIRYSYSCIFECSTCGGAVSSCGSGSQVYYEIAENPQEIIDHVEFLPKFFYPTIDIFQIHPRCPINVKNLIRDSFALAWADYSAAGNKLRSAAEHLLVDLGYGADKFNTLHSKIEALKLSNPEVGELLLALKWLGNDASHESTLQEYDLAFAYEIFEKVIAKLFDDKEQKFNSFVEIINSKRGRPFDHQ